MSASKFLQFPFLIIFKQIVQLWTCQYKHILILLWVFVTDHIVNSEHEMSTAKSLCYMAPPALVSICQPRKIVKNIRPSHPHHHSADQDILQILPILVTSIVNFLGYCSRLKFYKCTLTSVRTAFITNLQSTIFRDRIDILLSHYPEWVHEVLIMASLFPFLESFGISKFMYTHRLMFKSGFVYCPTAHNCSCILFIVITAIGLN